MGWDLDIWAGVWTFGLGPGHLGWGLVLWAMVIDHADPGVLATLAEVSRRVRTVVLGRHKPPFANSSDKKVQTTDLSHVSTTCLLC